MVAAPATGVAEWCQRTLSRKCQPNLEGQSSKRPVISIPNTFALGHNDSCARPSHPTRVLDIDGSGALAAGFGGRWKAASRRPVLHTYAAVASSSNARNCRTRRACMNRSGRAYR